MDRRTFLAAAASSYALSTTRAAVAMAQPSSLEAMIESSGFSGTALITRNGETLLFRGFGEAERGFQVPCARDTRYRIASITKLFTATMVLQLVAEKKLDLDRTIGAYLPQYGGPAKDQSTVRQLLHHTSGIENFDKGMTSFADAERTGMPAYQMPHSSDDLLRLFASGPLVHTPGSAFDYNNADFVILGKILEAIEGRAFDQTLQKRIVEPLKLQSTGLFGALVIQPKLAATYYADKGRPLGNDLPVFLENWYAAGGMTSTASDLLTFSRALFERRLVPAALLEAMLTPGLDQYGFGLWIATLDVNGRKRLFAQRPGQIMGANTLLLQFLDDSLNIILLGNTNLTDTDHLGFGLAKAVLGG
jgi:D-alanyl-D-alanine carboxypeptidase